MTYSNTRNLDKSRQVGYVSYPTKVSYILGQRE